jgi:hypothetical protein
MLVGLTNSSCSNTRPWRSSSTPLNPMIYKLLNNSLCPHLAWMYHLTDSHNAIALLLCVKYSQEGRGNCQQISMGDIVRMPGYWEYPTLRGSPYHGFLPLGIHPDVCGALRVMLRPADGTACDAIRARYRADFMHDIFLFVKPPNH